MISIEKYNNMIPDHQILKCLLCIWLAFVGLLLGQRRRRWPNNKLTEDQRVLFVVNY